MAGKRPLFINYSKKHNLAMPGSSLYFTIIGMANNTASLKDIMQAYPELSMYDILNVLEKGSQEGYLTTTFGNSMLTTLRDSLLNSSLLESAPSVTQNFNPTPIGAPRLRPMNVDGSSPGTPPKGPYSPTSISDPLTEEIRHIPPSRPLPTPIKETSWMEWIIPISITVAVVITVGAIAYYFWKRHKRTPPKDEGSSLDMSGSSNSKESHKSSYSSQSVSKFVLATAQCIIFNLFVNSLLFKVILMILLTAILGINNANYINF